MLRRLVPAFLALALPALAVAAPLHAVCTTAMVADVVRAVGGERVRVTTLIGSGVDPHLYKATRADAATLLRAEIVFYNGLLLEGKMTDALVKAARSGRPVYALTEEVSEDSLLEPPAMEGHYDPHLWMDPLAWSETTDVVAAALTALLPDHEGEFAQRAEAYRAELQGLHEYASSAIATIPQDRRVLVTAHDAFNYFARRYAIRVEGIQGISTESEAGLAEIEALVSLLVSQRIPAVFTETTVSDRGVRALIEGARAQGHNVSIGGSLFSDAMGAPGTYEGTYVGMIDHNVTTIVRALGGDAPARGMQGKLTP